MTSAEMITNFLLEYDRVASLSAPGLEDLEVLTFLNRAQYDLTDQLYQSKQWALLSTLIKTTGYAKGGAWVTPVRYGGANVVELDLTSVTSTPTISRFLYYLNSYSVLTRTAVPAISPAKTVKNENIIKEQVDQFVSTGFNFPIFRFPKAFQDGTMLYILHDSYTVMDANIYVEYLARPKTLIIAPTVADANKTLTSELHESIHEEVVSKAVQLALLATDPQRAAINTQIQNKQQ